MRSRVDKAEATVKSATAYALEETKLAEKMTLEISELKVDSQQHQAKLIESQQNEAQAKHLQDVANEQIVLMANTAIQQGSDEHQRASDTEAAAVLAKNVEDGLTLEITQLRADNQRAREGEAQAKESEVAARYLQDLADEQVAVMTEAHVSRWRVGSLRLDPHRLTADLRRVVPTITVEQEGNLIVIYSTKHLDPADFNRVQAEIQSLFTLDRT